MANRYWVTGGSGNWNATDTNNWSATSGGASGASVPTSSDDVFFDAASGAGTATVTATANCANLDFTGFTGTFAGSSALNIFGDLTLAAGMTRTYTGSITFSATTTGKTLTFNGITMDSTSSFNGVGGGWIVQDTWNNSAKNIVVTRGDVDYNGQTITCNTFRGDGSNTRTVTLGAATINCTAVSFSTTTNLTFNSNTSTINHTGTTGWDFGGLTWYNVSIAPSTPATTVAVTGANTFNNFTYTGGATKLAGITFAADQTISGGLTLNGNSVTNRILVASSVLGTTRTLTAATVTSLTNADFTDITGAGAGSWTGTSIADGGGNSGITFTTPVTRYWVGNTGNYDSTGEWSTSSGGATGASVPLIHDTVVFDANSFSSGTQTCTINMPRVPTMDFSGVDVAVGVTINAGATVSVFGGFSLQNTGTLSQSNGLTFAGRSSYTFHPGGKTFTQSLTMATPSGTLTLAGDYIGIDITHTDGTFTTGGYAITLSTNTNAFASSGTRTRVLNLGASTITLSGTGNVWAMTATGLTVNAGTSVIKLTNSSATGKTFSGAGFTYDTLWIATGSTGVTSVAGGNTFATLKSDVGRAVRFTAGSTTTILTAAGFQLTGSSGNVVTIDTSSAGSAATISVASGTVSTDYVSLKDSTATGGASFYAGANSTNVSGNTGWTFTAPPMGGGNSTMLLMGI